MTVFRVGELLSGICECRDERPESYRYGVTVPRDLLDALADHYTDCDDVNSPTDMLRQAARDVVDDEREERGNK